MMHLPSNPYPVRYGYLPDGAAGTRETLKLMRDRVVEAKRNPRLRLLALAIVRGIPEKDFLGEIAACFRFVQRAIRYTLDINGIETLQDPFVTFAIRAGDCDDKTMALAALLEILGHPCYLCAAGFDDAYNYGHVFLLVDPAGEGQLIALDTTEPHPPGWGPPGAKCFLLAPIEE